MTQAINSEQKYPIDTKWFLDRLEAGGKSMRTLAREMELDVSAVSRMLSGKRQMKIEEEPKIARCLGVSVSDVVAHRGATNLGFAEMAKAEFGQAKDAVSQDPTSTEEMAPRATKKPAVMHPAFGAWDGLVTLLPDYDYTQPADPDWGKVYDE